MNDPCYNQSLELINAIALRKSTGSLADYRPGVWDLIERYMSIEEIIKDIGTIRWEAKFNYERTATIYPIIPLNTHIDYMDSGEKSLWLQNYSNFT